MNLRGAENYNIGLDIGTGSVGWAVTNQDGELYHFNKKPTWGSRLFPSAESAAAARTPRGQRRRYDRRRQRLDLLQGFFLEEMEAVDPEFFIRLRQSRLLREDREEGHSNYRWPLFNDSDFTEQDYYEKFPTIYHLRKWLMETDEKADIRLIYLAFHNIVKTRGNFLHQDNPSLSAKNANMKESVDALCKAIEDWCYEEEISCSCKPKKIREVMEDSSMYAAAKRDELGPLFGFDSSEKARAKEIAKAVLGYKADFKKIYGIEGDSLSFYLSNDDAVDAFLSAGHDIDLGLFEAMQTVYSSYILIGILKGASGQTISYCKVNEYERYGEDLSTLKALVREFAPKQYSSFFRGPHYQAPYQADYDASKAKGYTAYNLGTSKLSYDDFKKSVEKLFKGTGAESDQRYKEMMASFGDSVFLRRLKTSDNGSIPFQLHLEEMDAIIKSQGKHYPFLAENKKEIESLVTFRIPYYVGPLSTKNAAVDAAGNKRFAWSCRKPGTEGIAIRPWNWEEIIDKDKSAEAFILRMTGTCTYLQGEPVLPRCSLLYEKFCVLNEFNGARWSQDGDDWRRFSAGDRLGIYEELFKGRRSVSFKAVEDWLKQHHRSNPKVKGGQGERGFESKLTSHRYFCELLDVEDLGDADAAMAEEIILWSTLFEDRDILAEKVAAKYGSRLSAALIKKIRNKRFTGWGRLSKKLLCELKAETPDGKRSIMDLLVEGSAEPGRIGSAMILMEILHDDKLGFNDLIDDFNKQKFGEDGAMNINDLPGSPALRRSVNQAVRIVEEIVNTAGSAPANIFIEVTRDDNKANKGRRTTRRYDNIKAALENLKADGLANPDILAQLKRTDPRDLDERLSLYFMQNGKSLYSGKPLDIARVISGDQSYQVDHIIPQSYIKDDSFENKALVLSDENQYKTDALLIDPAIRKKMALAWRQLHSAKLMGDKKYNNLMRDHITESQMKGFISRQLVETSQIVKFVRLMLEQVYPETRIESIKASLSSQLRKECGFVKCREANNFHHAHDAYLACEIGRFIKLRHPKMFDNPIAMTHAMRDFICKQSEYYKKHHRMPGSASFVIGSFLNSGFDKETGEVTKDVWDAEAEVAKIRRCLNYKQCWISRMPEIDTGVFWDETIYSPKNASGKKPVLRLKKNLDPEKYGGYSREQFAYFFVYEARRKGKNILEFATLPIRIAAEVARRPAALEEYGRTLAEANNLEFVRVARRRIVKYQLIEINGERLYLTGMKEVRNACELAFSAEEIAILDNIVNDGAVDAESLIRLYDCLLNKYERYAPRLSRQMKLAAYKEGFINAPEEDKKKVILSIVRIAAANANMINLTAIGGPSCAGCMQPKFSKELTKGDSAFVFIDQSVTGMFERRQQLEL